MKLIELKKVLSSKSKTKKNLEKIVLLKSKEDRIVNKINKFVNLLLEFSILFESKTIFCCFYNIIARFKLVFIEFGNLLIVFDYLRENKDRQILLF